jgi:enolase
MFQIDDIKLKIIKDSRGQNTLEVYMKEGQVEVTSSVPQGKSRGEREPVFMEPQKVLTTFQSLKPFLIKKEFETLSDFDNFLLTIDSTNQKTILGGNLTLVLSQGFSKLLARLNKVPLWELLRNNLIELIPASKSFICTDPYPYFFLNLINAGRHAPYGPKFQEYLIVPREENPEKALEIAKTFFFHLKNFMVDRYGQVEFGDEGGVLVKTEDYILPLEILTSLRSRLGLENVLSFSLDIAASSFFEKDSQTYKITNNKSVTSEELLEIYQNLQKKYQLLSLEDPFEENDFNSFAQLNNLFQKQAVVIGDDLTTTNSYYVQKAVEKNAISGLIIKPSQIGTISETLKVIALAYEHNLKTVVSHRSAETDDDFISDLAFGCCTWGLKAGAPQPKERMVKYNRVIQIFNF